MTISRNQRKQKKKYPTSKVLEAKPQTLICYIRTVRVSATNLQLSSRFDSNILQLNLVHFKIYKTVLPSAESCVHVGPYSHKKKRSENMF